MTYPDEMFDAAELTEKERQVLQIAKDAMERNAPAFKALAEMERNELIDKAIDELGWIVMGGQDGEEFYNSVLFIKKVLQSLKTTTTLKDFNLGDK
jgi:hypothetical protein